MPFAHSVAVTFRSPLALLIQGKLGTADRQLPPARPRRQLQMADPFS
jgi:hypothetical protein